MLVADLAAPGLVTVGVEQMNLASHPKPLRKAMLRRYPRLDGARRAHRAGPARATRRCSTARLPMWRIPNTVREIEPPQADMTAKRILAAGRLTPQKGFDLLIHGVRPGRRRASGLGAAHLRPRPAPAAAAGADRRRWACSDRITLAGPSEDIPGEMAQASVYVLSSRYEGFPLVLIEAMAKGMAVVAFDCPTGPSDIIDDHRNGILVPAQDVGGADRGDARDRSRTRSCAGAAPPRPSTPPGASRWPPVGPQWDAMLQELVQARPRASVG